MNVEKERKAISILQTFNSDDPYYACYSGGKDSDVIRILCELGGSITNSTTTTQRLMLPRRSITFDPSPISSSTSPRKPCGS